MLSGTASCWAQHLGPWGFSAMQQQDGSAGRCDRMKTSACREELRE